MTTGENVRARDPAGRRVVAQALDPTAAPPEPSNRVGFIKALLLFWLFPKRLGPHLASASFEHAIGAHLLAVFLAAAILLPLLLPGILEFYTSAFDLQQSRREVAQRIFEWAADTARMSWDWQEFLAIAAIVPAIHLALILLATAAMPWAAGGDRASSVWKRSVKNVYWSTTIVFPLSIASAAFLALVNRIDTWMGSTSEILSLAAPVAVYFVFGTLVIMFIRAIVVGAHRYVGPPDGPAFTPRQPCCDDCGYPIVGLPLETNCPECGLPVRESLPGGRRRPTRWHEFQFRPAGLRELLRIHASVLRGNDFFRRLPIHSGLDTARHFWWATLILFTLFCLAALRIAQALAPPDSDVYFVAVGYALLGVFVPFALQSAVMAAACLRYQFQFDIRDYRVSAIVCYYASPLIWPFLIVAMMSLPVLTNPGLSRLLRTHFAFAGVNFTAFHVVLVCLAGAALATLLFWWARLTDAIRAIRFANV